MFMAHGLTLEHFLLPYYRNLIATNMRKSVLSAFAFAISLCASAQNSYKVAVPVNVPKCLTPSTRSGIAVADSYAAIVTDMFELTGRRVQWAFEDRPSFDPEYAVKCIGTSEPILVATTASKNIWYNQPKNVEVLADTLPVSKEVAAKLDALFRVAIETSSFMPAPQEVTVDENGNKTLGIHIVVAQMDGNSYTFFSEGRSAGCGNQHYGPCKDLIEIGHELYLAVKSKDLSAITKVLEKVEPTKQSLFVSAPDWYPDYLEAKTNDLWKLNQ